MKIAIVTGASSGMGKEFVRQIERFYKELDEIWVIARSEKKLEEIKKSHKTYIRIFAGDMEEDLVYKQVKNRLENQNPDIRMLVMPHDSIDEATELAISAVTEELTVAYDLVITSEKKAMPVAAVAIYNNTICGYVPVKKVDVDYAAKHIKSIMKQNQFDKVVVKLFHDYKAFLTRAEGMNNIASVEQQDTRKHEEMIKGLLLDISL